MENRNNNNEQREKNNNFINEQALREIQRLLQETEKIINKLKAKLKIEK